MIKCEVVVRGNKLNLNGFLIIMFDDKWDIYGINGGYLCSKRKLEQAIEYCMEN